MNVQHKDATITNVDQGEDAFPGAFEVVLSTRAKDRDGDELQPEDWKQPLPDHITFDADHGMSVATTVGSGTPSIDDQGRLVVRGTYSSLPRAQEVRTLVNEGHIRTTSVAFMTEPSEQKDGTKRNMRELLNGAFVAIPSNREALVLASKSLDAKAGARNSKADAEHIQAIHDHAVALGASHGPEDDTGAAAGAQGGKSAKAAVEVSPDSNGDSEDTASGLDAVIDQAVALIDGVDLSGCPEEVQQALALLQAAHVQADELLDDMGVPDPDDEDAKSFLDLQVAAILATSASETE